MDDQLKQRLVGASIIVALVVAFVPLLFDEQTPVSVGSEAESGNVVPQGTEAPAAASPTIEEGEETYRIIPLTDAPGPDTAPAVRKQDDAVPGAPEAPTEYVGDEGAEQVAVPTRDSPLGRAGKGAAPVPVAPDKASPKSDKVPLKKSTSVSSASGEAFQSGGPAAASRTPVGGEPAKSPPGSKTAVARPKPASSAGEPSKAASAKPAAPRAAPPVTAARAPTGTQSLPASKSSALAVAPHRDDRKSVSKSNEPAKGTTAPKPEESAVKKRSDSAVKATVAAVAPATTGHDGAVPSAASAKPAPHAKSVVARKPKGAETPTRWVVQTSTFTSEANAKALADKLRKNKFSAYIETVPGPGGTSYRVTVGPETDKARAELARKRLESTVGMSGTVTVRR